MSPRHHPDQTRCSRRLLPHSLARARGLRNDLPELSPRAAAAPMRLRREGCPISLECTRVWQTTFPHKPAAGARQVRHITEKDHAEQTVLILTSDDHSTQRLVLGHPLCWGMCSLDCTTGHRTPKHLHTYSGFDHPIGHFVSMTTSAKQSL